MKVLHVAETIKGGVATILNQLLEVKQYHSLAIVPDTHFDQLDNKNKALTFKRTGRNFLSLISLAYIFLKTLFIYKPDIIHIHSSFAGVICRFFLIFNKKIKVIYCPHGFSFMMDVSESRKKKYALIEIFLAKFTNSIICTSEYERRLAITYGLPQEKLLVIYNGIKPPIDNLSKIHSPYNSDKLNILFVGRFDKAKAFDFVLDVSKKLSNHIELTVVGDYMNGQDQELPKSINHIKWLNRSDLAAYYYYADILFMPSRWESFGLVAVESHSYRTPVIASNNAALPEIISNKKNGYIFYEYDVDYVAEMINSLDKEELKMMAENCYSNYERKFSQQMMLDKMCKCYFQS